jgi:hypothetical protein
MEQFSTTSTHGKAVVVDSYAGVFPPGTQGPLIDGFGM